jgi:hypothetical protein
VFSFRPNVPAEAGVRLMDSTGVDPAGEPPNHSIMNPNASGDGGGSATGTFVLTFADLPSSVAVRLRAPTSGFTVAAFDAAGAAIEGISQSGGPYAPSSACCGQYYQARVIVTRAAGIARLEVNSGGQNVFLDNLAIDGGLPLVDFGTPALGGDLIDRGFYHPAYPGATLRRVDLWLSAATPGTYTVALTARQDSYAGLLLGGATVTAALTPGSATPVSFIFPAAQVAPGSIVTFAMTQVSPEGPVGVFYALAAPLCGLDDPNCVTFNPTIETEGTTAPLDTFRRRAVAVRLFGQPGPPLVVGPAGGPGGAAFGPISCAAGSVATRLTGRAGDDIDQTNLWCSPVSGTTLGAPVLAGGVGGAGGSEYDLPCPSGSALTGVHGTAGTVRAGVQVIDTLGVQCTNLATGARHSSPTVGIPSETPPFALACPAGTVVKGIEGGQGSLLDRISIRCQVPR